MEKDCEAIVKIRKDLVHEHTQHKCKIDVKMKMDKDYGILDGYHFRKETGNYNF